jgi:hypothetical protein
MSKLIPIPSELNPDQREAIGQAIITRIRERTSQGLDINGNPFAPYKKGYIETDDFQIAKSSLVNLRLTGDMLADLVVLSHGKGFIKIGFESEESAEKAKWIENPTGQKAGKQTPRKFVGISDNDLNAIINRFSNRRTALEANVTSSSIQSFVRGILGS